MRWVSAAQMRRWDLAAQRRFGIPELILMEHAGRAVAERVRARVRGGRGTVWVLAGGGANGGDGLAAARHLDNWGIPVRVALFFNPAKARGAAEVNLDILHRLRVPLIRADSPQTFARLRIRARRPLCAVDALLGTGLSGPVRDKTRAVIEWLNRLPCPVVAVDVPSGLSADSGAVLGAAVRADETVACGAPKIGLNRGAGRRVRGRLFVADISLPRRLWES